MSQKTLVISNILWTNVALAQPVNEFDFKTISSQIWHFKLAAIDKSIITVGTLVLGVFFMVLGIAAAKSISRKAISIFSDRLKIDRGTRHTLETMSFYFLLIIFTLFSMRIANLPITIFTVVGGALAIGIGFGSQNIVNNFISGLIIMIERPVKVGDFIEIDSLFGEVTDIGMRSTRLTSFGNRTYIIPNSSFLEKNVSNWTMSRAREVRLSVEVGVMYGTDTRLAKKIMIAAAKSVISSSKKEPEVFFTDFGDNALNLELNFWIKINCLQDFKESQSKIRFRIDDDFREADITIAYPQRDLYLHVPKSIPVNLTKP